MRMVIDWEDDTVLVEGKKIKLRTTESGIYILPLEKKEERLKKESDGSEMSTLRIFTIGPRNTMRNEVYDKEENGATRYYEEKDRYLNQVEGR